MKFLLYRIILIFPVLFSPNLFAQQLSMEEIINMRKMPVEQIDSIIRAKDFVKTKEEVDSGSAVLRYTSLMRTDTSLIQRTFTVGKKIDNNIELSYSVYQKNDAQFLLAWLEKNGFKKKTTSMPAKDGKLIFEYTLFQRKNQSVGYEEKEFNSVDKKEKLYIFTVNSFDFP